MPDAHAVLGDHGVLPLMVAAAWYSVMYLLKTPRRTSSLSGKAWVDELLAGNHRRFREVMRMEPETFHQLKLLLLDKDLLRPSRWVSVEEKLAIFLFIAGHAASNRDAQERFQRSGWTITRCFNEVLRARDTAQSKMVSVLQGLFRNRKSFVQQASEMAKLRLQLRNTVSNSRLSTTG
ncbi:unnamed protein product (mitochondrion) [Plasmodiophora brassicae]|uniref:DUF8040 domain-containing protein n=1 Tax=Plasmodiophora brassicae TaxID=37360 RepID=A0A3P3YNQ3_PLABS|nr:unnamed protein product [Plasmodiophora brassicae]